MTSPVLPSPVTIFTTPSAITLSLQISANDAQSAARIFRGFSTTVLLCQCRLQSSTHSHQQRKIPWNNLPTTPTSEIPGIPAQSN